MHRVTDHLVRLRPPQAVNDTVLRWWDARGARRRVVVVLAHGAGSDLAEHTIATLASGLADRGVAAGTFNFAYRQAGRRPPDRADRLHRAFVDVVAAVRDRHDGAAVVIGGRSLGGRVATLLAAAGHGDGVVALGYPLCPRGGAPDARRTAHWPDVRVPVLFVHGDRDRLCPVPLIDQARGEQLGDAVQRAHVVRGADHGFDVRVRDARDRADVDAEVLGVVDRWLRDVISEEGHHG